MPIGLKDAFLPFLSAYRPVWLGLGAVAFDLLLALIVTSLLRVRIGLRIWRVVHWLAYAAWPVALVHALGTGSDARTGWLGVLAVACTGAVALSVLWRAWVARSGSVPLRAGVALAALAVPVAILLWATSGPLQTGWAARAGTPKSLLASTRLAAARRTAAAPTAQAAVVVPQAALPASFHSSFRGRLHEKPAGQGLVTVSIDGSTTGGFDGRVHVALRGAPIDGGGVQMIDNTVGLLPGGRPRVAPRSCRGPLRAADPRRRATLDRRPRPGAPRAADQPGLGPCHRRGALSCRGGGGRMSAGTAMLLSAAAPPADELPRLLGIARRDGKPVPFDDHLRHFGSLPVQARRGPSTQLIELVQAAGLHGRGGAGFPTARKLRAVAGRRRSLVLANGAEGEPISIKDEVLLVHVPHLVLDGAALAASAVGADDVTIAVGGDGRALAAVDAALRERVRRRADRVAFRLFGVPDGFVAGEETALVNWLNGGPAKPTFTPPRPFERGLGGRPTLVQNVETLAHLALLGRFGADWFRAVGDAAEPGSALVTLRGAVRRPGVYEIPLGLPLRELVEWAGGSSAPLQAFLVGGYFGTWITPEEAGSVALRDGDLVRIGGSLGARAIFALPDNACGIIETARVARYLAEESAGQCGPCVHGLDAAAGALERLAWGGRARRERSEDPRLTRWLDQIGGRGACRHPDGAVRLIQSGLRVFADEARRHARGSCRGAGNAQLPIPAQRTDVP